MKMKELTTLKEVVMNHRGTFLCTQRASNETIKKTVAFHHTFTEGLSEQELQSILGQYAVVPKLADFYRTFSSLTLYHDEKSDDAVCYIAKPKQWDELDEGFREWVDMIELDIDEDDEDSLPEWVENCITIGEEPYSGNYFVMPTDGDKSGFIYHFDHDGAEFTELGSNIEDFVFTMLKLKASLLQSFFSFMTFTEKNSEIQWWVSRIEDNQGNVVER